MVAVVSGNNLGISLSSWTALGQRGVFGDALQGRGGETAVVNASNGNLVLQDHDDRWSGVGLSVDALRTYNSQGRFNDDNADNWSTGFYRNQLAVVGSVNTISSTVTRTNRDGAQATFNYDSASGHYISTDGGGAYQTITFDAGSNQYIWADTASGLAERYAAAGGRLLQTEDADGNKLIYNYNGAGLLTSITDPNGEPHTYFDYNGLLLTQIRTVGTDGHDFVRVRYGYDGSNRLSSVTVDLTPDDGSVADANVYQTTYTYDGASNRVKTVSQSDGTSLTFDYVYVGTNWRVSSLTNALGEATHFDYDPVGLKTTVTDALLKQTVFQYDAAGQLRSVTSPPVNGTSAVTRFEYNAKGDVTLITDAMNHWTRMDYDGAGNVTHQEDSGGVTIDRTYSVLNRLLTETVVNGGGETHAAATSRYVYDDTNHTRLRFVISAEGRVTEFQYNSRGEKSAQLQFATDLYPVGSLAAMAVPTEAQVLAWRAALGGVTYDSTADFNTSSNPAGPWSYGYSPQGDSGYAMQLFDSFDWGWHKTGYISLGTPTVWKNTSQSTAGGVAPGQVSLHPGPAAYGDFAVMRFTAPADGQYAVSGQFFAGDSGSMSGFIVRNGDMQHPLQIFPITDDASVFAIAPVQLSKGQTLDFVVGNNGRYYSGNTPVSVTIKSAPAVQRQDFTYDAQGRLQTSTQYSTTNLAGEGVADAGMARTRYVYDPVGRLVSSFNARNFETQYTYDGLGRVLTSRNVALNETTVNTYDDAENATTVTLPNGLKTTTSYDKAGRLTMTRQTDANHTPLGDTHATYDADGRLRMTEDQEGGRHWYLYDDAGRRVADVDASGDLTEYHYNLDNLLTYSVKYGSPIDTSLLVDAQGQPTNVTVDDIRPDGTDLDLQVWQAWDDENRLARVATATHRFGGASVVAFSYDGASRVSESRRYASTVNPAALDSEPAVSDLTPQVGDDDRVERSFYDSDGLLIGTLDAAGGFKDLRYDGVGHLVAEVQHLNVAIHTTGGLSVIRPTPAPGDITTRNFYDGRGQLVAQLDGDGNFTETEYDAAGNVHRTLRYPTKVTGPVKASADSVRPGSPEVAYEYTYDALNRVLTRTIDPQGLNLGTTYTYDDTNNVLDVTDAANVNTRTHFDLKGQVLDVTVDTAGLKLKSSWTYDKAGRVLTSTDAAGVLTKFTYAAGRLHLKEVDPSGLDLSTYYYYDAFGNLSGMTDANDVDTSYQYDGLGRLESVTDGEGGITTNHYNQFGQLSYSIRSEETPVITETPGGYSDPTAQISYFWYDVNGRLTTTMNALGETSSNRYDAAGRLIETIRYAKAGRPPKLRPSTAPENLPPQINGDSVDNRSTRFVYDALNRLRFTVDATGAVSETRYDYAGRIASTVEYAQRVDPNVIGDEVQPSDMLVGKPGAPAIVSAGADDRRTQFAYDRAGRLLYSGDALGGVVRNRYDRQGNVIETIRYGRRYSGSFDTTSLDAFYALAANQTDQDRHSRVVYDAAGRAVFSIDALGGVVRDVYDDGGRLARTLAYSTPIDPTAVTDVTTPADMLALLPAGTLQAREVIYTYDAVGRRIHTAVSQGISGGHKLFSVVENVYDKLGQLKTTTSYAALLALEDLAGPVSRSAMGMRLAARPAATIADDRTTQYGYDNVGRLTSVVDPDGYSQFYYYNRLGDRTAYVDQNDNETDYEYDRAGRLVSEQAPEVEFFRLDANLQAQSFTARLETRYGYNAFGELSDKTEAYGQPEQRVTRYAYDAVGRQVLTTFDAVGTYDSALDSLANNGAGAVQRSAIGASGPGVVARTETQTNAQSRVVYNVFGEAIINQDAAGNFSYKTYDKLGRLLNEVDANGNALSHYYSDIVGKFSGFTQLDGTVSVTGGLNASEVAVNAAASAIASTGNPRSIVTYFDKLGRESIQYDKFSRPDFSGMAFSYDATTGTSGMYRGEIDYSYDVFGDLTQRTELLDGASGRTAKTRYGYDLAGNLLRQVDADGYVTDHVRNAFGQDRSVTQYATALAATDSLWTAPAAVAVTAGLAAATGADRTVTYKYDHRGNKTEEAQDVEVGDNHFDGFTFSALTAGVQHVVREFETDGAGNLVRSTDGNGQLISVSQYDAFGRLLGTNTNGRSVFFRNNALGQQIQIVQSDTITDGVTDVITSGGGLTTTQVFDRLGRVIQRRDAKGADTFMSYDQLGRLAKEWTPFTDVDGFARNAVKVYSYDKVGRVIETRTLVQRTASDALTFTADTVKYNNFGEVASKLRDGAVYETNIYDVAGHLWKSNAGDGVYRINWYDLHGNVTSTFTSSGTTDLSAVATPADVGSAAMLAVVRRTTNVYDSLSHLLKQTGPVVTHLDGTSTSLVAEQVYDAWGNVVSVSRNGSQRSTLRYTTRNQLARSTELGVASVAEDGSDSAAPLVRSTYYDVAGRKSADVDARGNATLYGYREETGDLETEARSDGTSIVHGYDNYGRETTRLNAGGVVHRYEHDNLGHLTKETVTGAVLRHDNPLSADATTFSYTYNEFTVGSYSYDELGNRITQTSGDADLRSGVVRRYSYDTASRLVRSAIAGTSTTVDYSYDGAGRKTLETDALGQQTHWFYRADGRLSSKVDIGGATTLFEYDLAGQLSRQSSDRGQDLRYTYDAAGRISTTSDLWNNSLAKADYDEDGNRIVDRFSINSSSASPTVLRDVTMVYDALGRMTHVADGTTYSFDIQYDANGNRRQVTGSYKDEDSKPVVVNNDVDFVDTDGLPVRHVNLAYSYDVQNRVLTQRSLVETRASAPLLYSDMSFGYDVEGNRIKEKLLYAEVAGATARTGREVDYQYDALGRLTETFVTDKTVNAGAETSGTRLAHRKVIYDAAQGMTQEWQWMAGTPVDSMSYSPGAGGPDRILKTETVYDSRSQVSRVTRSEAALTYYTPGDPEPAPAPSPAPSPAPTPSPSPAPAPSPAPSPAPTPHGPPLPPGGLGGDPIPIDPDPIPGDPGDPVDPYDPYFYPVDPPPPEYKNPPGFGDPVMPIDGFSTASNKLSGSVMASSASVASASAPAPVLITGTWYISVNQSNFYDDQGNLSNSSILSYGKDSTVLQSALTYRYGYAQLDGYKQNRATVTGQQFNGAEMVSVGAVTTSSDYDVNGLLIGTTDDNPSSTSNKRVLINDDQGHILVKITGRTALLSGALKHTVQYDPNLGTHVDLGVTESPTRAALPALSGLTLASIQHLFYANGQSLGSSIESTRNVIVHTPSDGNMSVQSFSISSDFSAGFGVSQVQGLQGGPDSAGPSQTYTWSAGDTLRGVAQTVYGDANLWWVIADANGVSQEDPPEAGSVIRLPSLTRSTNGAGTGAVYNAGRIVGDTTPEAIAPPIPSEGDCAFFAQAIIIVIAIVVTIITSGATAEALASAAPEVFGAEAAAGAGVAEAGAAGAGAAGAGAAGAGVATVAPNAAALAVGGAVGGAVGSIVSQGAAMALGLQQSFSWKQVGIAAIGGAVGGGLKTVNPFGSAVLNAAAGNLLTQGLAVATGLQQHFDWRSVAASAIAAPIGQLVSENLNSNELEKLLGTRFAAAVAENFISGTATQLVRQAVYHKGHLDFAQIVGDAFGNAIGESQMLASAPDQSDAETARLNRYEKAAQDSEIANLPSVDIVAPKALPEIRENFKEIGEVPDFLPSQRLVHLPRVVVTGQSDSTARKAYLDAHDAELRANVDADMARGHQDWLDAQNAPLTVYDGATNKFDRLTKYNELRSPEAINKAYAERGGFTDTKTEAARQDPLSSSALNSSARNVDYKSELKVSYSQKYWQETGGEVLLPGYKDQDTFAGIQLFGDTYGGHKLELSQKGVEAKFQVSARGEVEYLRGQESGSAGNIQYNVGSGFAANLEAGGSLSRKFTGDIGATAGLDAALVRGQVKAQTIDVSLPGLPFAVNAGVTAEGHLVGAGLYGSVGVKSYDNRPGYQVYFGAGLTAFIGGRLKFTVGVVPKQ